MLPEDPGHPVVTSASNDARAGDRPFVAVWTPTANPSGCRTNIEVPWSAFWRWLQAMSSERHICRSTWWKNGQSDRPRKSVLERRCRSISSHSSRARPTTWRTTRVVRGAITARNCVHVCLSNT